MQLTAKHKVATPAQWQNGDNVILTPAITDEEAANEYNMVDRPVPYVRFAEQPKG